MLLLLVALPASASVGYFGKGAINGVGASATDAVAAPPANTTTNDVGIVTCFVRNTGDTMDVSGYTQIAQKDTSTGSWSWWWARSASGALGTATCNSNQTADKSAIMHVFRGATTSGNPYDVAGTPEEDSPAATFTVATLTTLAANDLVAVLSGYEDDDLASFICTATDPAAPIEDYTEVTTSTSDSALSLCFDQRANGATGATGTITLNYSGNGTDQFATLVISLVPQTPTVTVTMAGNAAAVGDVASVAVDIPAGIAQNHGIIVFSFSNKDCAGVGSGTAGGISTVTDTRGNTYARDATRYDATETIGACIYSAKAATALSAGDDVTITYTGATGMQHYVYDIDSFAASSHLDTAGTNFQTGTATPSAVTAGSLSAQDTVVAGFLHWDFLVTGGTLGYTVVTHDVNYSATGRYADFMYKDTASGATETAGITESASTKTVSLVAAYKQTAAAAGTCTSRIALLGAGQC